MPDVRNADIDGNPDTTADPNWSPLVRELPEHPLDPSQHGCFTAGFTRPPAAALGTNHLDVTIPGGANGSTNLWVTQHFKTVNEIQKQEIDTRVWIGVRLPQLGQAGREARQRGTDWGARSLLPASRLTAGRRGRPAACAGRSALSCTAIG